MTVMLLTHTAKLCQAGLTLLEWFVCSQHTIASINLVWHDLFMPDKQQAETELQWRSIAGSADGLQNPQQNSQRRPHPPGAANLAVCEDAPEGVQCNE